jgi:thiol-disulfide isomerase/thioredoxin
VALVLLMALSAAAAGEDNSDNDLRLGQFIPVNPPQPEPQAALTDLAGRPVSLAEFRGTPVVVNLWATWCGPCLAEMPSLDRLQARLGGRIKFLAISEDAAGSSYAGVARIRQFVARMNLGHLAVYIDPDGSLLQEFEVRGLPTSIIIDAQGRVVGKLEGASDWMSPQAAAVLRPFLPPPLSPLKPLPATR